MMVGSTARSLRGALVGLLVVATLNMVSVVGAVVGAAPAAAEVGNAFSGLPAVPTAEEEPNGTTATAQPILSGGRVRADILPTGDIDIFAFTAAAGDRVYAATMTVASSSQNPADTVLDLLASDGTTIIETDNDNGILGATSSSIAGALLPTAGTYFLKVRPAPGAGEIRPYDVYLQVRSGTPATETENNDTVPGQALPAGNWVTGALSTTTDVDAFRFTVPAGATLFTSVDLDPERDTVAAGVQWDGQLCIGPLGANPIGCLLANDAPAATDKPSSEAHFVTVKEAGEYFVSVQVQSGAIGGTYHLSVTVIPPLIDACTRYDSTDVPKTIPTPGVVTSTVTIPDSTRIGRLAAAFDISHDAFQDLDVTLTAPAADSNTVSLFTDVGGTTSAQGTNDFLIDQYAGVREGVYPLMNRVVWGPEPNTRLDWFDGEAANGTWTLTVRDDATPVGGTLNRWGLIVCPVAPPVGPVVYSSDFESGAAGWTHSGAQDEWELGLPSAVPIVACNGGSNCWKTDLDGTYNPSSSQDLISPRIAMPASGPTTLQWAQKFQLESANFDHYTATVREVGNPANNVLAYRHTGGNMIEAVGSPSVTVNEAAGWGTFTADLTSLAGKIVEIVFHLDSDTTVNFGGVAIDDVSIFGNPTVADLSVTKTDGVTNVSPGGTATYTITASNAGPDGAAGATVTDTFPAAITAVSWTCGGTGGGASCAASGSGNIVDVANLPVGTSVVYTAIATIGTGATGTMANTATVAAIAGITDPTPGNNSATDTDTVVQNADLSVTKTDGVISATPGGSVTYTVTASNSGPNNVTGATVTDTLPATLTGTWTCVGAGGGTCTAAGSGNINDTVNLPAGGSVTYTVSAIVSASATGTLSNTATVAAPSGINDPNPGNNSATDTDTLGASSDLSITKTDGVTSATAGGSVTYTIVASNAGPSNATGATVSDTVPATLTSPTWTCVGAGGGTCPVSGTGNISAAVVNLPPSATVTFTLNATLSPNATGTLSNTATIAAPSGSTDPVPSNNAATDADTIGVSSDLSITKTDGVTSVGAGGAVSYTIVASNAGPSNATGATVSDTVPSTLTSPTWTCVGAGGGTCPASGTGNISAAVVNLPPAATVTFTLNATLSASATGSLANTATIAVASGTTDPTPANNSATDTDTIVSQADLVITKTGPATALPLSNVTYTLGASNAGPGTSFGVSMTDTLPAGTTFVSLTQAAGPTMSCVTPAVGAGGTITCTAASLANAASVSFSLVVHLGAGATSVANTASVSATTTDPAPLNNSATATIASACAGGSGVSNGSSGSLSATSGTMCVINSTVNGTINLSGGAKLFIYNSTVTGAVTVNGTAGVTICGATLRSSLSISNSTGFVLVGDPGDDGCAANAITGAVLLAENKAGINIKNSSMGSLTLTNNTGGGPFPSDVAPSIEANSIMGALACTGNTPAPSNNGKPNYVKGTRSGQCTSV
jgi:uncharacterized repeat protein (TIGR01451 family)